MTDTTHTSIEYPSEIHRLLKIGGEGFSHTETGHLPEALPTHESPAEHSISAVAPVSTDLEIVREKTSVWKVLLVYPFVFLAAFLFFYVIFNISSLWAQVQSWFIKPQAQVQLGADSAAYYNWIGGYYYTVNDTKLLDPNNDIDKDGLSNMDEFIMHTNPTVADSDTDGFSDGIEVINNMNPWGSGTMTSAQKKLAEGLNAGMVNNRIGYNAAQNNQNSSGSVLGETKTNYDLNKPGKLSIPRLNLQVPLVWSKDASEFENDLVKGVIHYPGTAMPGETGVMYVSGHSSDYLWKQSPFRNVFATLNRLQPGDDIFIEAYGIDGKTYNYRYQVVSQATYSPDDQMQFIDSSANKLNLSTCWPIGTSKDRLVVTAVQKPL